METRQNKTLLRKNISKFLLKKGFCSRLKSVEGSSTLIDSRFSELLLCSISDFSKNGSFHIQWLKKVLLNIDRIWFRNELFDIVTYLYGGMTIDSNVNEPSVAGYVMEGEDDISFFINQQLVKDLFKRNESGYHSGGLICKNRLTCILHIILHEMVHVALSVCERLGKHKELRHHGKTFLNIVKNMFGHTESQHGLIPGLDHNFSLEEIKKRLRVGQHVNIFIVDKWIPVVVVKSHKKRADVITLDEHKTPYSVHMGLIKIPLQNETN